MRGKNQDSYLQLRVRKSKASPSRIMGHRQQWISPSIVKSTSEAVISPSYPLTGHCLGKYKGKTSWNCCLTFSRTAFSRYYMVNVETSGKISIKDVSTKRISNCYTVGIQVFWEVSSGLLYIEIWLYYLNICEAYLEFFSSVQRRKCRRKILFAFVKYLLYVVIVGSLQRYWNIQAPQPIWAFYNTC